MARLHAVCLSMLAWCSGPALAQETTAPAAAIPVEDVMPARGQAGVVHVNGAPETQARTYRGIAAGMDRFDRLHALAPAVPQLVFQALMPKGGQALPPGLAVKLSGDTLSLPLALDGESHFTVPRSQAAWDQKAELVLNQKKPNRIRIVPWVRSPGLAPNVLRLGDLRLECQAGIAIAKEEAPLVAVLAANAMFRTSDWCNLHKERSSGGMSTRAPARVAHAVLQEGNRSRNVQTWAGGWEVLVPLGDASWGDDALVMLEFAPTPAPDAAEPTRTAAETPRTAP